MFISFIGPFGVGKTTITRYLADSAPTKYSAVFEDLKSNAFLESVWKEKAPEAFEMQVNFIADICCDTSSIELAQLTSSNFVLYDRSLIEAAVVYPHFQQAQQLITLKQKILLNTLYTSFKSCFPQPDLYVFCRAEPEIIFERIKKRARAHEEGVTLKQIEDLVAAYETIMSFEDIPCFDLDTEQTLDKIKDDFETILFKVF